MDDHGWTSQENIHFTNSVFRDLPDLISLRVSPESSSKLPSGGGRSPEGPAEETAAGRSPGNVKEISRNSLGKPWYYWWYDDPWCWYIYLPNWVISGVNVGKYIIHGSSGWWYEVYIGWTLDELDVVDWMGMKNSHVWSRKVPLIEHAFGPLSICPWVGEPQTPWKLWKLVVL